MCCYLLAWLRVFLFFMFLYVLVSLRFCVFYLVSLCFCAFVCFLVFVCVVVPELFLFVCVSLTPKQESGLTGSGVRKQMFDVF